MSKRHRRYTTSPIEVRDPVDAAPVISGYAAVFNQETVIGAVFREVIRPGAFSEAVKNPSQELKALLNHNPDKVLGAISSGTLRLSEDSHGLRYEVDINTEDTEAMSALAKIRRGDVNKSSFGFMVPQGGDKVDHKSGQLPLREILRADLFDVSPVTYPAYSGTSSMSLRSSEEVEADHAVGLELIAEQNDASILEQQQRAAQAAIDATVIRQKRQDILESTL